MTPRLRLICLVVTVLLMLDTIRRIFAETKAFDWLMLVVELLVLLLIAFEVGVGIVRHRKENLRKKKLDGIVGNLSDFMFKGQTIAQNIPNPELPDEQRVGDITEWMRSVEVWRTDVAQYLSNGSSRAAAAFLLVTNAKDIDNLIHPLEGWSFYVAGPLREHYQALLGYLQNLRNILEKPEIYF